jgi:5-methylcytosine-specific restriction enzyme A
VHARTYEAQRPNAAIRGWYHTPRWRALRAQVLREEPWCSECEHDRVRMASTDVDHITPHEGDATLFWDRRNLQSLCHGHHSRKTRAGG